MPRKKKVPALVFHRPSGQGRVRIKGKDHYCGKYDTDECQERYEQLIAEMLADKSRSQPSKRTVNSCLMLWWVECKKRYGKFGKGKYGNAICWRPAIKLLREAVGERHIDELGDALLIEQIIVEAAHKNDWSLQYCRELLVKIKIMFRWLRRCKLCEKSTLDDVNLAEIRNDDGKLRLSVPLGPVEDALVEKTLPLLRPKIRDMVMLQRRSGMRPGEVCALRVEDIDRSDEVWIAKPGHHKTKHKGKVRTICFGPKSQLILNRYIGMRTSGIVFRSRGERGYTSDSYRRAIQRILEKHKLPNWSPQQIRKAAATEAREEFDVEHAASFLGHSSSTVTGNHYAATSDKRAKEVARLLG